MLNGIRVVELGSFITAPLAAMMLADLGADVIKVERPEGDPFRNSGGGGRSKYGATFLAFNRNKRSVVLDTKLPADQDRLKALVAGADVFIDNVRPGVLAKIGLDPKRLQREHPRLIHCSVTGFGDTGPYAKRPAFDHVGQALSGITSLLVDPERPEAFGPTISDNVTAMYACYGIMGALIERWRTGKGRRIEVNMLEASMAFIQDIFAGLTRDGTVSTKFTRISRSQAFVLTCADGRMLAIHLSTTEKFWTALVAALGDAGIADDPRFARHASRVVHYHELADLLRMRFRSRTRDDWMALLSEIDVPFAPIQTVSDVLADPQVAALASMVRISHPSAGDLDAVACPVLVDGVRPATKMRAPPTLGEHTADVLAEVEARSARPRLKPARPRR